MTFAGNGRNTYPKLWLRYRAAGRSLAVSAAVTATVIATICTAIIAAAVIMAILARPVTASIKMPWLVVSRPANMRETGAVNCRRPGGFSPAAYGAGSGTRRMDIVRAPGVVRCVGTAFAS